MHSSLHPGSCNYIFFFTDDSAVLPADPPDRESPASKFPQSAFAPYNDPGFAWNPSGTGLAMDAFDFPILLLDNVTAPAAIQRAADNAQRVSSFIHVQPTASM